jgi:GDP-L-fucose synthase
MKVAILGANGSFGRYFFENLQQFDISPVTRKELNLTDFNQTKQFFSRQKFDAVINCAINPNSSIENFNVEVASSNLLMFSNLHSCRNLFGRLISFGSGAEFDRSLSIDNVKEEEIFNRNPLDHYGMSKNICSRISATTDNFYTLRLFGSFFSGEPERRLLRKIFSGIPLKIEDRYFDYFWMGDAIQIVDRYLRQTPIHKDINLVYPNKILISEFINTFCKVKNIKADIELCVGKNNYTGSAEKIESLDVEFTPLIKTFESYK